MKLLFDQNLSFRLVPALSDLYPASRHIRDVDLTTATDEQVWKYAAQHGFTIISKDVEFHQRSLLFGAPPKVVWVGLGNCSTDSVGNLLRRHHPDLLAFEQSTTAAFLALR